MIPRGEASPLENGGTEESSELSLGAWELSVTPNHSGLLLPTVLATQTP